MPGGVIEVFNSLPVRFARSPALVRRAEKASAVLLLDAGQARVRLELNDGTLSILSADGPMRGWDTALRATPEAWVDHWQPIPAPDAFDILGMARRGRMLIEGNFTPLLRHLQIIKDILALPRVQT